MALTLLSIFTFGSGCTGLMEDFINIEKGNEDDPSSGTPVSSTTSTRATLSPGATHAAGGMYSTKMKTQYNDGLRASGASYSVEMNLSPHESY